MSVQEKESKKRESSQTLSQIVERVAAAMSRGQIGTGDLAELRRVDMGNTFHPSFWRIMLSYVWPDDEANMPHAEEWALILSAMARMAPFHYDRGISVGDALARSGFSEGRLMRLLRASGKTFHHTVRRACIYLAAKDQPVDWRQFATLILTTNAEKGERLRERIAVDYYRMRKKEEERE